MRCCELPCQWLYRFTQISSHNVDIATKTKTPIHMRIASPICMLFNVCSQCSEPVKEIWIPHFLVFAVQEANNFSCYGLSIFYHTEMPCICFYFFHIRIRCSNRCNRFVLFPFDYKDWYR